MDMFREWKREDYQKKLWNGVHQEEENEEDLNWPGWIDGRKGIGGGRQEWQTQLEEEDNIINDGCRKMWTHGTTCYIIVMIN
jgi:hypothetical protein